jgi:hypothetical protein
MTLDGKSIRKKFRNVDWLDAGTILVISAAIASLLKTELPDATFVTFVILWIYWIIFSALICKTGILGQ